MIAWCLMSRSVVCASLVALGVACTGQHDAGGPIPTPPCTPFDVGIRVTDNPQVVWIGDEYLVAVSEGVLHIVSSDGALDGNFTVIPQSEGTVAIAGEPYAWSGSSLGVVVTSNDTKTFELVRFGHDGTRLGQTMMMSGGRYPYANVVWANDRFAVAWIDSSNNTVNVQEISPDGVLGTARQVTMADVGKPFTEIFGFASTATSYAIKLGLTQSPTVPPVIVVIDRTTGAVHAYDSGSIGNALAGRQLVARDPGFALLVGSSPAQFETLDGSAMPGSLVNVSVTGAPTMLATTAGFHVYDLMETSAGGGAAERTGGAGAVFRGNGYAAFLGYGSGTTFTLRMLQQCIP